MLHPGLVVVCVGLGSQAEGVGLETGLAEHSVEPKQQVKELGEKK
jgi:hypothetical protein